MPEMTTHLAQLQHFEAVEHDRARLVVARHPRARVAGAERAPVQRRQYRQNPAPLNR